MSWNGSGGKGSAAGVPQASRRGPASPLVKGVIAAVLVVIGAVAVFLLLRGGMEAPPDEPRGKPKKIAEAPAAQTKPKAEPEAPKELPPQKVGEIRDGKMLLQSGRLHPVRGIITNKAERAWSSIFPHPSENVLAGLLVAKPGEAFVGTPRYNGRFTKNFLESLKEPIIVSQDDPEDIQQLKRAVNEAKIEMKAAYDRGEDIEEMLLKAREELQKMSRYKQELKADIYQFTHKTEGITDQDVDDYIAAANMLLEAKGIAPLKKSWITGLKLKMNLHMEDKE